MNQEIKKKWVDQSSYSREGPRARGVMEPDIWILDVGGLHIAVMSGHRFYPGEWVMSCEPWFTTKQLPAKSADQAKTMALSMVRSKLMTAMQELEAFLIDEAL